MNRRDFFAWVGVSAIATSLPVTIAACSSKTRVSKSQNNLVRPDGFKSVGTVAELDQKGHLPGFLTRF